MERYNGAIFGIDLGTTNSAIAVAKEKGRGRVTAVTLKTDRYSEYSGRGKSVRKDDILPSVVFYPENEEPMVGDIGIKEEITQPYNVIRSVKSQMGNDELINTGGSICDKTPEEVSARILRHLVSQAEKMYCGDGEKIEKIVITVPASFDAIKREATKKAGKLAGLEAHLISEPQAVAYSLINQLNNDDIDLRMDFREPKRIMVFDIGGGTLDITLQDIVCDENDKYTMTPIATNRYSTVAGDRFDEQIAEFLYEQFLETNSRGSKDIEREIKREKTTIMREIRGYAEDIKQSISNSFSDAQMSGRKLSKDREFECGGLIMNRYTLDGYMSVEEFEKCLEPLMGTRYIYSDYKSFPNISDNNNIMYPVMDVLYKAAEQLGSENIEIDGVILNGGMSRLYLIQNRLKEFFKTVPIISVTDPDKSVAEGAAIYHYYQNFALGLDFYADKLETQPDKPAAVREKAAIETKGDVLADDIYLGMKGGVNQLLIKSGTRLPYSSQRIEGFKLERNRNEITFPINRRADDKYETIATGIINFRHSYTTERDVTLEYYMNQDQLLFFKTWVNNGRESVEGEVSISFGGNRDKSKNKKGKLIAPKGSRVEVNSTIGQLRNLCCNEIANAERKIKKGKFVNTDKIWLGIKRTRTDIASCCNPEEFAKPIISELSRASGNDYIQTLLRIARSIACFWSDEEVRKVSSYCEEIIKKSGNIDLYSPVNANHQSNFEAIKFIGRYGNDKQLEMLRKYENMPESAVKIKYQKALICAYNSAGVRFDWIFEILKNMTNYRDIDKDTVCVIGQIVLKNKLDNDARKDMIISLSRVMSSGKLKATCFAGTVIALGYCCRDEYDEELIANAEKSISDSRAFYGRKEAEGFERAIDIALMLINKKELSENDEKYIQDIYED